MKPHLTLVTPLSDKDAAAPPSPPAHQPSDDLLMTRAAAGERAAYAALVERYQVAVRRFCACIVTDDELARDLAQDVFLKVWAVRHRYTPNGRFKAFLFTVARNMCRSENRKRRLRSALGLDPKAQRDDDAPTREPPDPHAEAADERMQSDQTRRVVWQALQKMDEKYRVPLMMRYVEELPYEDIAGVIGRTESTARSRVHYGLKRLAGLLPPDVAPGRRGGDA